MVSLVSISQASGNPSQQATIFFVSQTIIESFKRGEHVIPALLDLSPSLFLIYVNDMPNPSHHHTNKSQFADDAGQY